MEIILEVKNLSTNFYSSAGIVKAVDDVSFSIKKGQVLGIVGESGSGKSVTSLSILRLTPKDVSKIESGQVLFKGEDLLKVPESRMRAIRGGDIGMIFQEPMTSLNPVYTVGSQITEALMLHKGTTVLEANERAIEMMNMVRIPDPQRRFNEFPHQLSGGMRQRVMIAMALCCEPEILICDEPTTALDVTIQAQILELIKEMMEKFNSSVVMITHNMGVIAEMADEVIVMYAGKVAEQSLVDDLFQNPLHPYTEALLRSMPKLHSNEKLKSIRGMMPQGEMPEGCLFNPRCDYAKDICLREKPEYCNVDGRTVACWKYHKRWEAELE